MRHAILGLALFLYVGVARAGESPITIVTLGDSITRGVRPGVKAEETFSALLQQALAKKGVTASVINAGIGGERTDQAIKRLAKDVIARKPALVTIMYGHNDSHVDKGKKESRLPSDEFRANLKTIVAELRKAGIKPILMTPTCYAKNAALNTIGEHHNVKLGQFAQICREVAKETGTPLIDHWAHWHKALTDGVNLAEWTTDLYHLNPRGHEIATETMLPVVFEQLKK